MSKPHQGVITLAELADMGPACERWASVMAELGELLERHDLRAMALVAFHKDGHQGLAVATDKAALPFAAQAAMNFHRQIDQACRSFMGDEPKPTVQ